MSWRASDHDDGPEPLPPHELLRLRRHLVAPPRPEVRDQHLSAITAELRSDRSAAAAAHALVRRSARVVAGVAGIIVVTSGLAGAQIIPEPARSLIPAVSDRLAPHFSSDDDEPEEDRGDEAPAGEAPVETTTSADPPVEGGDKQTDPAPATKAPATTAAPSTTASPSTTTSTSSSSTSSSTSTTEPDSSTTSTTEPDPSTTTTSTTQPDTSTTTTTVAASSGPPWAHGRAGEDGGGS